MMRSLDPGFQVAENEMDHGQVRFGFVGVAAKRQCSVVVSHLGKPGVAGPSVSAHRSAKRDVVCDKAGKHFGAPIRHNAKPQASRIDAASVSLSVFLTRPDLDCSDYDRLVMRPAPLAARLAADKAFIDFDHMLAANGIAFRANQRGVYGESERPSRSA